MDVVERRAHASTTGSARAQGLVVDGELRVLGLEGLRVVDASVMPTIARGNANAPTLVIGDKAARLIRSRAPLPGEPAAGQVGG